MGTLDLALKTSPQQVLGYRHDGRPIRAIAGGSTPAAPAGTTDAPQGSVTVPVTPPPPPPAPAAQTQTFDIEAERERIRQQLQADFDRQRQEQQAAFDQRLAPFEQERAEQQRLAQEAEQQRLDAERRAREAEETAAQTAQRMAEESQRRIQEMQERLDRSDAVIAREQEMNRLSAYSRQKIEDAGDALMPHLRENVFGNSEAEIDARLSRQIEISQSILSDTQAALSAQAGYQQAQYQAQPGTTPTMPVMGPLEGNGQGEVMNLTPQQIRDMPLDQYAQVRGQLTSWTGQARRQASEY